MRTWWFDPRRSVKRDTALLVGMVLSLWGFITYWKDPPLWSLLLFLLPVIAFARFADSSPGRLAALAEGALITVDDYGHVTLNPLTDAVVRDTPQGRMIRWEDGPAPPEPMLRRFPAPGVLAEAIEAAHTSGVPSTSHELARRLAVVPVLTSHRWIRLAYVPVFFLAWPVIRIADLSLLFLLPMALIVWLDVLARSTPWAAITLRGLWLLQFNQEPVWIPLSEVTAIHYKWGGLDSLIHTTHPGFPTLALGIRPQDLHRMLPAPAAWLEGPKPM